MANYWAVTIGINQYRHLQPLMHAQNDALFLHRFFVEEAGLPANRCVLLSDLATSVGHQVVYPDKPAIAEWVQTVTQQVGPEDVLWFFFSGYGVQLAGSDYLMPIDGDPASIEETGIAIADLVETLSQLPTDNVLLVLDINRSQGALAGQAIGTEVIELAQQRQLPTLLSCQPEQYSHETFGVRHGLFTAAMLEALRQQYYTLGQISEYITNRLPELCEHHWRPIQNPVSLISDECRQATVVPAAHLAADAISSDSAPVSETATSYPLKSPVERPESVEVSAGRGGESSSVAAIAVGSGALAAGSTMEAPVGAPLEAPPVEAPLEAPIEVPSGSLANGQNELTPMSPLPPPYSDNTQIAESLPPDPDEASGSSAIVPYHTEGGASVSGARLRNWGLLALAVLMGGVLLKQPFVKTAWQGLTDKVAAVRSGDESAPADTDIAEPPSAPLPAADTEGTPAAGDPDGESQQPEATSEANSNLPADTPADTPADAATDAASPAAVGDAAGEPTPATGDSASEGATDTAGEARALIAQANAALDQKQYSEALIALQQVPKDGRDATFSSVLTRARAGAAEAEQYNASVLTEARTSIQPTQASQFTEAIAQARQIQPGEPYYEEAQRDIRSWSQIILDIAEGRATSGNLDSAIAAARVMPYDNADFHQKAQDRIAFWQQRQRSREIIAEAQQIPRSGQASTYQKGIVKLGEVPIEHPEYETAQRLADEWSERIFSIAQARAAQGRRSAAVQAAILVPAGTTAYEPTQQAIRRWQAEE